MHPSSALHDSNENFRQVSSEDKISVSRDRVLGLGSKGNCAHNLWEFRSYRKCWNVKMRTLSFSIRFPKEGVRGPCPCRYVSGATRVGTRNNHPSICHCTLSRLESGAFGARISLIIIPITKFFLNPNLHSAKFQKFQILNSLGETNLPPKPNFCKIQKFPY
jgi:hypothetical protein